MRETLRRKVVLVLTLVGVELGLLWGPLMDPRWLPYHIDRAALSGWRVVLGAPEDPWIVALEPPAALTTSLFQQVSTKAGRPLIAPPHTALPLVLRPEHDDALQGCTARWTSSGWRHRKSSSNRRSSPSASDTRRSARRRVRGVCFLAVNSPAFNALRLAIRPDFPEHAGIGVYDPGALTAVLPIAATGTDFGRWWPIRLERITDCEAQVTVQ